MAVEDVFGIVGTTLAGTFLIEEVIAEGGYGVVYRAEHVAFRAPVALKCLKIPGTVASNQSAAFVENFREEAEILFHLSAQIPEVVRPLHADAMTLENGSFVPYIAMEWVEGTPLDSVVIMRQQDGLKPLSMRKVVKVLTPIAHALHRAHNFKVPGGAVVCVTHCDLKPENILIGGADSPFKAKVLDFGIAKAREAAAQGVGRITDATEQAPFTPSYGAPEQWVPKRFGQTGPWTDVWGMALTIVECVCGDPPNEGDMHAMMGTALDPARRPTPRNSGCETPDNVERVFALALAVDPRERYQDVESFWTALEGAVGAESSFAKLRDDDDDPLGVSHSTPPPVASGKEFNLDVDSASPPLSARSWGPTGSFRPPEEESSVPPRSYGPAGSYRPPEDDSGYDVEKVDYDADELMAVGLDEPGMISSVAPPARSEPPPPRAGGGRFHLDLADDEPVSAPEGARPAAGLVGGVRPAAPSFPEAQPDKPSTPAPAPKLPPEERGLLYHMRVPLILMALGLLLTIIDMALARKAGGTLSLGPIRLRWIAATLVAAGIVWSFWALVGGDKDDE